MIWENYAFDFNEDGDVIILLKQDTIQEILQYKRKVDREINVMAGVEPFNALVKITLTIDASHDRYEKK